MIYTSARWADEAHTQVTGTDADGRTETVPADYTIFRCPDDGPIGFVNNGGVIADYVPPTPDPYRLFKKTVWERVEEGEDELLEAAINNETAQLRQIYHATEYFQSDDTLFAYMHWVIAVALGSEEAPNFARADALLAPEAQTPSNG
jgi:hypothetical protein